MAITRGEEFFQKNRTIYWPGDYYSIVNLYKGLDTNNEKNGLTFYSQNTGPVILAAIIGMLNNKKESIDPKSSRQEIELNTFEGAKFGSIPLTYFIALIVVIGKNDIELLREENEDKLIDYFQEYVAGGLRYLQSKIIEKSDETGLNILNDEIKKFAVKLQNFSNNEVKKLF